MANSATTLPWWLPQSARLARHATHRGHFAHGVKTTRRLTLNWSFVQVAGAKPRSSVGGIQPYLIRSKCGGTMRSLKILPAILVLGAMPVDAAAQQPTMTVNEVVDKIVRQEQTEEQLLRQYSPLVETYIQNIRPDKQAAKRPTGGNTLH